MRCGAKRKSCAVLSPSSRAVGKFGQIGCNSYQDTAASRQVLLWRRRLRGSKTDKTGRTISGDKFARMFLKTMQCPAWQALSPYAQRLYPWLILEWDGAHDNNNGSVVLSVRQASDVLRSHTDTAMRAFLDLQAKGFIVVTRCAALGVAGKATRHEYEITELGTRSNSIPRKLRTPVEYCTT